MVSAAGLLAASGLDGIGDSIVEDLPGVVEDAESLPLVGPALEERDAARWVEERVDTLPDDIAGNGSLGRVLPTAGTAVVGLFWVALIAVALTIDGPRLMANARSAVPARSRRQVVRTAGIAHRAVTGYATGAATVAALNGAVVTVTAFALGIPLAPVLGLWAFLWNFVPQIGGFMGGAALVALAFTVGPLAALAAAAVFIVYQFTENHLIQPALISARDRRATVGGAAGGARRWRRGRSRRRHRPDAARRCGQGGGRGGQAARLPLGHHGREPIRPGGRGGPALSAPRPAPIRRSGGRSRPGGAWPCRPRG